MIFEESTNSFLNRKELWALLGTFVGFALTEATRLFRSLRERRKLRKALLDELDTNYHLLEHTKNTIDNVINSLKAKTILPATSVPSATAVFSYNTASIIILLKPIERDVIQNIYSRLRIVDSFLESFEDKFGKALLDNVAANPWVAYQTKFKELRDNCEITQELIKSVLDKKPIDLYGRNETAPLDKRVFAGVVTPEIVRKQRGA